MEALIKDIKQAYAASEKAFSHEPMPFDERVSAVNQWWAAVTPEKVMRLVNCIEKGGYTLPPEVAGKAGCSVENPTDITPYLLRLKKLIPYLGGVPESEVKKERFLAELKFIQSELE